jgi:SAM-dependent methyltransferase
MNRYMDYDPFAWLYANYWGQDFHRQIMPALDRLLLHRLPRSAKVLDLCCGDGRLAQKLARKGYRVTGLDGSERMLSYAKRRASQIEFYLRDARRFQLPAEFDAVISTFDSLNHIMSLDELSAVFCNVHRCLRPGGLFAFDLNRPEAYEQIWVQPFTWVTPDAVAIAQGTYDRRRRLAHCDITLFRLQDGQSWERSDFRLSQKCHAVNAVTKALRALGFAVETFDAAVELGMRGETGQGRTFFLATS